MNVRGAIAAMELPPFDPLNRRAAQLREEGHPVISLGQAVPYFPPPAAALDAARAALDGPEVNRYATDPGLPGLRAALAERLSATLRTSVTADDVMVTAGANHAFALALATLVDPGSEVVLPAPYFTNHEMAVRIAGAVPVEAPLRDRATFAVRWQDIEAHVTPRTRAVVLCNPSNPTGRPIDAAEGSKIVGELARRGIVVISDETYMQFVYEGDHWSAASVPGWRAQVVVVGTCSKSFGMMGWRVGFMLADAAVCAEAVKVQDAMIICAPAIGQIAAEAAVRAHWDHAASFHGELRQRRQVLHQALAAIPRVQWTPSRGGLFALARIDGCDDSTRLSLDLLERAHVVTIPGAMFGRSAEGYLRLSYGYAAAADLQEAVRRLARFLASSSG